MTSYSSKSHSVSMKRKEVQAFREELGAALSRRAVYVETLQQQISILEGAEIDVSELSDLYVATQDFTSEEPDGLSLKKGDIVEIIDTGDHESAKRPRLDPELSVGETGALLDSSAARHKLSVRPRRKHADPRQRDREGPEEPADPDARWLVRRCDDPSTQGWVAAKFLVRATEDIGPESQLRTEVAFRRREAAVRELVETEEEFGRDLRQVVERYMQPLDSPTVPRVVRDNKDVLFSNLKQIADFHNTMKVFSLLGATCLVALMHHAAGFSSGAPPAACGDLVPQHKVPPQKGPSPYAITVSKKQIRVGEPVKVTITGKKGETIKGFMCQAHVEKKLVGNFQTANGYKIVECNPGKQDAITHTNAEEKPKIEVTWVAPEKLTKPVNFVCTIAKDGGTFWVGEKSESILVN